MCRAVCATVLNGQERAGVGDNWRTRRLCAIGKAAFGKRAAFFYNLRPTTDSADKDKAMSSENKEDPERIEVSAPGDSPETERRAAETAELLRNTRALLDLIPDGDKNTRRHIEELKESLEAELRRMEGEGHERDGAGNG